MSLIKKVLYFIGGKPNDIFNKENQVQHHLPKEKWRKWEGRFLNDPAYNWRAHSGMRHKGVKKDSSL